MLLIRKGRVTHVPALSLVFALVLAALFVHQRWVMGTPVVRLLHWIGLEVVFLAVAVVTACRLERRDERIHWWRLWRHGAERTTECAICAYAWEGRHAHLDISLLVRGESVLEVTGLKDGPEARAKAQRVAEALALPLEHETEAISPAQAGTDERGGGRGRRRGRGR